MTDKILAIAISKGWSFRWFQVKEECDCGSPFPHDVFVCDLKDANGRILRSTGQICGPLTLADKRMYESLIARRTLDAHDD